MLRTIHATVAFVGSNVHRAIPEVRQDLL